jgi:hypothetical protein
MTYAPHSYPPPSPFAPPSVGPTAKYAGTLLLILGILALLMGGCFTTVGAMFDRLVAMPEMQNDAKVQKALADMEAAGGSIKVVMIVLGVGVLVYSVQAIVVGIVLLNARTKTPVIVGLVMVALSMVPMLILMILFLRGGEVIGGGFMLVATAMHGLILMWIIQALRAVPQPMMVPGPYQQGGYYPPSQYQQPPPMQGYQYQPPQQQPPLK